VALFVQVCSAYLSARCVGSCKYMVYTKNAFLLQSKCSLLFLQITTAVIEARLNAKIICGRNNNNNNNKNFINYNSKYNNGDTHHY
jgi:hypothetical protein